MEFELDKSKNENKILKATIEQLKEHTQDLARNLKLVTEERDTEIGKRFLAIAQLKEQTEELQSAIKRAEYCEDAYIKLKLSYVEIQSQFETMKDELEAANKILKIKDTEINNLSKSNDRITKNPKQSSYNRPLYSLPSDRVTRNPSFNESKTIDLSKNIKAFPSSSYSFNLLKPRKRSIASSLKGDENQDSP